MPTAPKGAPHIIRAVYEFEVCDSNGNDHDAHIYVRRSSANPRGFRITHITDVGSITEIPTINHEDQAIQEAIASVWPLPPQSELNSDDGSVTFSEGSVEGDKLKITNVRTLRQSVMRKCPHFIMVPGHYRADDTCRCNDKDHTEMSEWGYTWDGHNWK